jgi:DNA topoisomerase-1
MSKSLVVVESPTKAKTLSKFLGEDFVVKATVGHIKDLPENELGIDIEHGFKPLYGVIGGKSRILQDLKKTSQGMTHIYLAPDPDREGEAIAWHVWEELDGDNRRFYRVLINELTRRGVQEAIRSAGELRRGLYEAQQARRVLDRLVGYKISPLLWQEIKRGLSAGRVQSVVVRLICEREREIWAFRPAEYWTIEAHLKSQAHAEPFKAKLAKIGGKKVKISSRTEAEGIAQDLEGAKFIVSQVGEKEVLRHPPPPFITSKLQQDASRRLRFSPKKTMRLAQDLYEGIELGEQGPVGLITYMRTDSPRISGEALREVRDLILNRYGEAYLPAKPNVYKSKKGAQEAHEAIRPTSMDHEPEKVRSHLTPDQWALYRLIWDRFLASQMTSAVFLRKSADIEARDAVFNVTGSVPKFPGFMTVYSAEKDQDEGEESERVFVPPLKKGEILEVLPPLACEQHFTQAPSRFSESTLVKELEDRGIGRPSTYASILSTVQERGYVRLDRAKFHPTELGFLVNDLLVRSFPSILNVEFTARMEDVLDAIEEQKVDWAKAMEDFYGRFSQSLKRAETLIPELKREVTATPVVCDQCGSPMVIRWGRKGFFLACTAFPECRNTQDFVRSEQGEVVIRKTQDETHETCPTCGSPMVVREGRFGAFYACSQYPRCKTTKPKHLNIPCPQDGCDGFIAEKRSRKGRVFYGCTRYPECTFALWDKPVNMPCPQCGAPFVTEKPTRTGTIHVCKRCGTKTRSDG